MSMGRRTILSHLPLPLVRGIPSRATLVVIVLTCGIPMLFRSTRKVSRNVNVFALSRETTIVLFGVLATFIVQPMRETSCVDVLLRLHAFVLCEAYQVVFLCPVMTYLRIDSITHLVTRQPSSCKEVIRVTSCVALITLLVNVNM